MKYAGKKPVVTCPNCGAIVPVGDPIPPKEPISPPIPWLVINAEPKPKPQYKANPPEYDFENLKKDSRAVFVKIKAAPRFPVVLTGIWSVWFLTISMMYFVLVNSGKRNGRSVVEIGDRIYLNGRWDEICLESTVFVAKTTAFLSLVLSAIAYFWIAALDKKPPRS